MLRGAATEFESEVPFAAFAAARLLDDVGSGPLPDERYRVHREVAARLERMADGRPLLLVVDDAHWADRRRSSCSPTCSPRRPPPLVVLVAFRPEQARGRLAASAGPAAERDAAAPLSREAAAQLLRAGAATRRDDLYRAAAAIRSSWSPHALDAGPEPCSTRSRANWRRSRRPRSRWRRRGAVASEPFEPELVAAAASLAERGSAGPLAELDGEADRSCGAARVPLPPSDRAPGDLRP